MIRHKVMTMTEFYDADAFDIMVMCTHLEEVDRDAAERMRMIVWAALAPNSKRKIQPTDVVQFSWEKHKANEPVQATTNEMFENAFKQFKKQQK